MDSISSDGGDKNFIKHVFNMDDDSKSEMLNILQYSLLAILPVLLLNKSIGRYVPEADDKKGSIEITAEVLIQVIVTFFGLLIIHRIITFIPTYSKVDYPEFHVVYIILAVLMIMLSLQTKLGEKTSILVDRVVDLWDGKSGQQKNKKQQQGDVKVSQPISGQQVQQQALMYSEGTSISALPSEPGPVQQLPNYDSMYRQDTTPLVGAATPGVTPEGFGPVAASEFLGGGFGSSW